MKNTGARFFCLRPPRSSIPPDTGRENGIQIALRGKVTADMRLPSSRFLNQLLESPPGQMMANPGDQDLAEEKIPKTGAVQSPEATADKPESPALPRRILVIDLGGTEGKVLASGQTEPRKTHSGPEMSPPKMVEAVKELAKDWEYDAVSLGYPGRVGTAGPRSEAGNLAPGWVGFDFASAFNLPIRVLNDAAMQALGSYEGGRMLFLGLGTGLGSTLIAGRAIVPLELGCLRYSRTQKLSDVLGRQGFERLGKKVWRAAVGEVVHEFLTAFEVDYVVLGGGNSTEVKELPAGARLGHNQTAFRGGFRLWNLEAGR